MKEVRGGKNDLPPLPRDQHSGRRNPVASLPSANDTSHVGTAGYRNEILSQVRELREREKRADSVVLRGLGNISLEEVKTKFEGICHELQVPLIPLTGLTRIGAGDLYRAKIASKEQRQSLLLKVSALRNSQVYSRVYINRDLTKQQREEVLSARRRRLNAQDTAQNSTQSPQPVTNGVSPQETVVSLSRDVGRRGARESTIDRQRGRGGSVPRGGRGRGDSGRGGRNGSDYSAQPSFRSIPHVRNF